MREFRSYIIEFTEYLFVLIMILNANTIWTSFEDSPLNRVLKVAVVVVGLLYIVVQKSVAYRTIHNILLGLGLGVFYIATYTLAVGYKTASFSYFVFTVIAVYAFLQIANRKNRGAEIFFKYRDIMLIVAVVSMFFWLLGSMLGIIHPTGIEYTTWVSAENPNGFKSITSYYGLYFETQTLWSTFGLFGDVIRNSAIFTEAPMCNFNFCMALIIELFYNPKPSKIKSGILITAIVTTLSTTGYCMLTVALTAKFLVSSNKKPGLMKLIRIFSLPALAIVVALTLQFLVENKMSTSSGTARLMDFMIGFGAWSHEPFFGYGYEKPTYYMGFHYGFSNSIIPILGHGGLFLALPYIYCIFQWCRACLKEKDFQKFLLFANFMFLFTITIMPYKYLSVYILFAYCMKRTSATEKNINKGN